MLSIEIRKSLEKARAILCFGESNLSELISIDKDNILLKLQKEQDSNVSFNRFLHDNEMIAVCYVNDQEFSGLDKQVDLYSIEKASFSYDEIAGKIAKFDRLEEYKSHEVHVLLPKDEELAKACMKILALRRYKYSLNTKNPVKDSKLVFVTDNSVLIEYYKNELKALIDSIFWARDLSNTPANILNPQTYKDDIIKKFADVPNITVKVLDENDILAEKMGALYGVAQGSYNKPYVVVIEYLNADEKEKAPIALAGKGVCFDTGGISLKPANRMSEMKHDMHGSATVVATMLALAKNDVKENVIGIVGLVENMPGGGAQRPGDIVTSRSGQTVEMLNSDAEGRLVLIDIIDYVQDVYKPNKIIDLATLTGAVVIALGHEYAGVWSNSFNFASNFIQSSYSTLDKFWRMPLHDTFNKGIDSKVADFANINTVPVGANSCTAAHFIGRVIKEDVQWIHIDIAGAAFGAANNTCVNNGGNGFGVDSIFNFIKNN